MPSDSDAPMDERMMTEPTNRPASMAALLPLVRYGGAILSRESAGGADSLLRRDIAVPFRAAFDDRFRLRRASGARSTSIFRHGLVSLSRWQPPPQNYPDHAWRAGGRRFETRRVRAFVRSDASFYAVREPSEPCHITATQRRSRRLSAWPRSPCATSSCSSAQPR